MAHTNCYSNEYARDVTEDTYSENRDSFVSYTPSSPSPSDISSTTAQRQWRLNNQQWAETQARDDAYQRAAQQHSQEVSKYDILDLRFGSLVSVDSDVSSRIRAVSTETGDDHIAPMPPPSWPRTSQQTLGSMRRPRKDDYLLETDDDSGVQPKRRKTNRSQHRSSDAIWDHADNLGPSTPSSRISNSQMTTGSTGLHSTNSITNPPTPTSRPAPTQDPRRLPNPTSTRNTPGLFMTPGPDEAIQQHQPTISNAHHPPPFPSPTTTTTTTDPDDNPTHRARLRAMAANPKAHAYVRKRAPESDPENRQIKHLRQHDRLHWTDIADTLNAARVAAGLTPTFTVAAVYGRFARVAPRIAEAEGEEGFDHKDYLYFKQEGGERERERKKKAMPVLSRGEEELLAGCYEEVERERWVNLARKFKLRAGVELSPEQVARKFRTL